MEAVCALIPQDDDEPKPSPVLSTVFAGAVAGFVTTAFIYPLDTLKTRLQCAEDFRSAGGFRGIFKGFWIVSLGYIPVNGLFYGTYETIKNAVEPRVHPEHIAAVHMCTGSACRLLTLLLCVPVEVAKQRQQVHRGPDKLSVYNIWKNAYREDGVRNGLYRGFASTLLREIPYSLIEMPIWELMKATLKKYTNRKKLTSVESAGCAVVASAVAGALTTPLDLVKTRVMLADIHGKALIEKLRIKLILKSIYLESGISGLFAGLVPRVIMLMIGGFIFYGAYEESKDYFDEIFSEDC